MKPQTLTLLLASILACTACGSPFTSTSDPNAQTSPEVHCVEHFPAVAGYWIGDRSNPQFATWVPGKPAHEEVPYVGGGGRLSKQSNERNVMPSEERSTMNTRRIVRATIVIDADDPSGDKRIHRTLHELGLVLCAQGHQNVMAAELLTETEERAPADPYLN